MPVGTLWGLMTFEVQRVTNVDLRRTSMVSSTNLSFSRLPVRLWLLGCQSLRELYLG